jgi:hypothetical protein
MGPTGPSEKMGPPRNTSEVKKWVPPPFPGYMKKWVPPGTHKKGVPFWETRLNYFIIF